MGGDLLNYHGFDLRLAGVNIELIRGDLSLKYMDFVPFWLREYEEHSMKEKEVDGHYQ